MKSEKWSKIGEVTDKWVAASYPRYKSQDVWKAKDRLNAFLEFLGVTDTEFLKQYKQAPDRTEWARSMGGKIVEYYNELLKKYAVNTARSYVSSARAFCRDNCQTVIIQRKRIAKPERAKNEHEFTRPELSKMFAVADTRDKAILATAVSLGFSIEDFVELQRDQIESLVSKAAAEKIDFVGFDAQRGKTKVESRSHLTPEARDSLKEWFAYIDKKRESESKSKSRYVFPNGNDEHLSDQAVNDIIKDLVAKANIMTTGKIRFHLIRKFLMNALHDSGFDDWAIKRAMGKEIPTSDSTYLQGLNRKLDEDFKNVYEKIRLAGYSNGNHTNIEMLKETILAQQIQIDNLTKIIELAIPKVKREDAIRQIAKQFGVGLMRGIPTMKALLEAQTKKTQKSEAQQ
jgi:site-specific recombinase XerD